MNIIKFFLHFIEWFFLTGTIHYKFRSGMEVSGPPVILLLTFVVFLVSINWVARDAVKRGKNGYLAGFMAAVVLWPVSLLLWLWLRPNIPSRS